MAGIAFTNFPAISGGLPTRPDLAPSIVFIVAYFGLLFPTLWRTYTYRRPRMLLFTFFRLIAFILIRIATFGLRASEAVNDSIPFNPVPDIGVFIAEQILLGIGYIVMVDLQVELSERHIGRTDIPEQEETIFAKKGKAFLQRLVFLMHTALLAAIVLGITAGAMYSSAISSESSSHTVRTLRIASTVIVLAIMVVLVFLCVLLLIRYPHLGAMRTSYLLFTACLLLVIPAFRLSTSVAAHPTVEDLISTATRVKFYILQCLLEYVVVVLLIAVDVRVWFFAGGKEAQRMLDGTHPHAVGFMRSGRLWGLRAKQDAGASEKPSQPGWNAA